MLAKEMSERDIREILARSSIGRLGCSRDDQPYVLPISFAYEPHHLYAFSTEGQKIEWMRTNPKVCLEVDEITDHSSWTSVVIFGRYRELPDLPQFRVERYHAKELLKARALWWEHAYASRGVKTIVEVFPLFYCIEISSVTGYRSVADRPPKPKPING